MHAELLEGLLGYPFARVEHDESQAGTGHLTMANPRAVQLAKFRRCWALAPRPLADAVIGAVEALDSLADVRDLTALVRGGS
jgi:hypothetical protein